MFVFLTSCGTINRALDIYEGSVGVPDAQEQTVPNGIKEQVLVEVPGNLSVQKVGQYDMLLSWDEVHADNYVVYRAWSYPQFENSYRRVGETMDGTYYVENAYWSGIHYYAVRAVVDGVESELSSYVKFAPHL